MAQQGITDYKNYIYLKYYNFLSGVAKTPDQVFMETKTWIKTKIAQKKFGADNGKNEKMRKKIEDALNYFYNPSLVSEQGKNDLSFITEEIKAKVEEALGSANTMHMGNLSGGLSQLGATAADFTTPIKAITDAEYKIETLETKMSDIISVLNKVAQRCTDASALAEINEKIVQLEFLWGQVLQEVGSDKKITYGRGNNNTANQLAFKKMFNTILKELFVYNRQLSGQLGENFSALALAIAGAGKQRVNAMVQSQTLDSFLSTVVAQGVKNGRGQNIGIVGQQATVTAGVGDIYASDIAKSNKGFVNIFGTDNVAINKKTGRIKYIANHNPTQNKVDIEFSIDGKPLGASIKNYNLESTRGAKRYGISLVSGTPVWSLIGDKGEFLQHYLNVTSEHGYTEHEKTSMRNQEPDSKLFQTAHDTMKLLMFANALAGGQYYVDNQKIRQTGIADFFIVHDTAKNKWVVCWTQDVINQMFTDYLQEVQKLSLLEYQNNSGTSLDIIGYPKIIQPTFSIGNWESMDMQGIERIAYIYSQLLPRKIYIHMHLKVLKNLEADYKKLEKKN